MEKDGGTRRRWPWVVLGTGLATFFAVAVALSIAAAGPGPGLAPAAAPPTHRAAAASHPSCGSANTICPVLVDPGQRLSSAQTAALQPRSHRVEQAVSTIDWCATPDHGPCTGQGRPAGTTSLTDRDVEVVRAALDRAGFRGAHVSLFPAGSDAAGSLMMIRYTVALGPGCVTGYLAGAQESPLGHTLYAAGKDGRCWWD